MKIHYSILQNSKILETIQRPTNIKMWYVHTLQPLKGTEATLDVLIWKCKKCDMQKCLENILLFIFESINVNTYAGT